MSAEPPRGADRGLPYVHQDSTEDTVFTEAATKSISDPAVPAPASAAVASPSTAADAAATSGDNNNNVSLPRADSTAIHVTFSGDVNDDSLRHRSYSTLRLQAPGSFTANGSMFTNGNIVRNVSGLQGPAVAGEKKAPASSPLGLLYQSFANPVSDAQAIENAVREALGHEPMWAWNPTELDTAAPPVVVHDGADEAQATTALSTGDELRGCVDPSVHYIFRNVIRAPRGERPRPYLYTESPDNLALAAAAQAAVRHRHRGLQSFSSESPTSASEVSVNETVVPLVGRRHHHHHHTHSEDAHQEKGEDDDDDTATAAAVAAEGATTSISSSQARTRAAHEPTAGEEEEAAEKEKPQREQQQQKASSPALPSTTVDATSSSLLAAEEEVSMDPANKINRTYLCTGAFHAEPIDEADIGKEELIVDTFNALPSERRRLELLEAFYVAHIQPYEQNASYTADDWDDMTQTKVPRWFGLEFDPRRGCFFLTLFRRRVRIFLFSFLFRAFCLFLFWVIMFCLVPKNWFYPGGLYFDTIDTIIFAGIAGTIVARILTIPSIVGVIWAGILWNNVPYTTRLTKGITLEMRQFISMFGLTIGLIRAGLSLNVIRFKQKFKHYITFSLLPMSMEMVVHGVCCKYIYNYPNFRWAFAEGFLLSSIAPSVVVPVIISFQRRGYGVRDGPSMMMLCSIAVDTAVCVWGIEFLLALEFHKMDTALLIVLAPIQVVVGLVGGVILGALVFVVTFYILFMEGERLPSVRSDRMMTLRHSVHVRYISIFFMVLVAFSGIAIGKRFSVLGGSAIGVVTIAGTFNYLCVRGGTADHLRVKADMAQTLTTVWDYIAMPSLFGLSGAAVNVHELFARDFIGQAFGLVFIGVGTRSIFAMLAPMITRLGLSWPEILFCGLGWIGKGSVQGSLGSLAQTYAAAELAAATTPEAVATAEARVEFGRKMKNTAVLGILVACPLCSIFLTRFTDRLLKPNT